jgi:hypothetical protein
MRDKTSADGNATDEARTWLKRVPALQRPSDLDLLMFFTRHWRTLLTSEQLARLLGYPLKEIARSRDALVAAGLLTRVQDPARPEGMYVLDRDRLAAGPAREIVALASTPAGRASLRRTLLAASARESAGARRRLPEDSSASPAARPALEGAGAKRRGSRGGHASAQHERTEG